MKPSSFTVQPSQSTAIAKETLVQLGTHRSTLCAQRTRSCHSRSVEAHFVPRGHIVKTDQTRVPLPRSVLDESLFLFVN